MNALTLTIYLIYSLITPSSQDLLIIIYIYLFGTSHLVT